MRVAYLMGMLLPAAIFADPPCRNCHPREAHESAQSAHAHALEAAPQSAFFRSLPGGPIGEARGGFLFTYQKDGGDVRVTAQRGSEAASAEIEWVFGAGRRAQTPVVRHGAMYLEHRISYYSAGGRFDLTMGHTRGISFSAGQALGQRQTEKVIRRCFGCHSTGGMPEESSFAPGISCERCHQGAGEHAKRGGGPVGNPAHFSAQDLVKFCAACHRDEPEGDPNDAINVRYQPVRLRRSKCFRLGHVSCLTCHDPHSDAPRDVGWYRTRCLECHADQKDRGDCLACHMPKVSPVPRMTFTDHYIR
ncbi:MAG: hypothetical protein ACRD9L_02350 [Bryobacteraceae bacterium]